MKTRITLAVAAALAVATPVFSQTTVSEFARELRDAGFTKVELKRDGDRIKVEGVRGGWEREVVWDTRTGRIVKDEYGPRDEPFGHLVKRLRDRIKRDFEREDRRYGYKYDDDDDDDDYDDYDDDDRRGHWRDRDDRWDDDDDDDDDRHRHTRGRGHDDDRHDRGRARGHDRDRDRDDRDDDDDD